MILAWASPFKVFKNLDYDLNFWSGVQITTIIMVARHCYDWRLLNSKRVINKQTWKWLASTGTNEKCDEKYEKLPVNERFCPFCLDCIEDECHVILECPVILTCECLYWKQFSRMIRHCPPEN